VIGRRCSGTCRLFRDAVTFWKTGRDHAAPASIRHAPVGNARHHEISYAKQLSSLALQRRFCASMLSLRRLESRAMPFLRIPIPRLPLFRANTTQNALRAFSTSPSPWEKSLPPRTPLLDSDLIEKFLHGSGPGGQKINKTSSAVQLKHIPTGIVVKYQDTRSRTVNRKMARKILQERIEEMELGEDARTKVKARERSKKKASADKKKRRKYRKIGEAGREEGEDGVESVEGDVGGIGEGQSHEIEEVQSPASQKLLGG
jgi:hypothetical protein